MNKKIKRIIAMTLVLGSVASVAPNKYFALLATKAYASSSSNEDYGIDDLIIKKGDSSSDDDNVDDELTMYSDSGYSDFTTFEKDKDAYYLKTSGNSIKMKVNKVSGYTYKIFKSGSSEVHASGDELDLKSGDNVFYIRTYDTGDFNEKNVKENQINCYEIHVQKMSSSNIYLKDISLSDGSISFSKDTLSYNVEVGADVDQVKLTADPEDNDYTVKINDSKVTNDDNFRKDISLNKGKNTIKVQVGDDSDNSKTYTLNIYRGTKVTASDSTVTYGPTDDKQPAVYLDNLQLDNGDIGLNFKKNVSIYNVKVDSTMDEIDVTAKPEDSDSKVVINNKELTSDNDYDATLKSLTAGENTFTIKVTDKNGNSRNYTLNVYQGVSIPTQSTTTTATAATTTEVEANQWVQVAGKWQYNGKDGNPLKNQLFYDDNYKKTYYLNAAGFLDTGWQLLNDKYYYADNNGAIQKGWLNIGSNWYHLDVTTGQMNTGWFSDGGKWYYLNSTGEMAHDTYVGQYELGSDGAWIQ